MRTAFEVIKERKNKDDVDHSWREAAYTHAVDSVLTAETYRSNVPES
jgi:hypothetical protein